MACEHIATLSEGDFGRLSGVKRDTFNAMLSSDEERKSAFKHRGGRRPKLSATQRLLLTLEYLREYRTRFHIAQSYGISESGANRIIRQTEDIPVKSGLFSLPGKKALSCGEITYTLVSVDAAETPCERPKKGKNATIQARKKDTR